MTQPSLLPPRNATAFMRAFEQATAYEPRLIVGIDTIPNIKGRKLPSWLQFLLYEYGLIELTPYVQSPYTLLEEGRQWQIERDTWAAITRGLGWVGSPGTIEEARAVRRWWNSFQVRLAGLPASDVPQLERIDRVTQVSKPLRSDFRRAVHVYDGPALEADHTRLDMSVLDNETGVRLRAGGPLWSLGRVTAIDHKYTEAEGLALDNWQTPVADVSYQIDLIDLTALLDEEPVPFETNASFARAGVKWHSDLAGVWYEFAVDEIATTDRGALIEPAGERLSAFTLDGNPLDDDAAALVVATGLADPLGGTDAIRVEFNGSTGRTLLVPAEGLSPSTEYSVSFFAKLVSSSGVGAGSTDPTISSIFSQLVEGEWVRVAGLPLTTGPVIDGQWFDITLSEPGATLTVELFGFQIEAGGRVTSPIPGPDLTGERAADELTLLLPAGSNNLVITAPGGAAQSLLDIEGPYLLDPDDLDSPLVVEIKNIGSNSWQTMPFQWELATFPWGSDAAAQRAIALAQFFPGKLVYFALKNAAGNVIGYRRARATAQVEQTFGGSYLFNGLRFEPSEIGETIYFDAMTDAGNGAGQTVATVEAVIDPDVAPGQPPGRLWLPPGGLVGGTPIAATPVSIPLRATVREHIKIMLRF